MRHFSFSIIFLLVLAAAAYGQAAPVSAEDYYKRGVADHDGGDDDEAIIDLTKAISINPRYAEAYYERGRIIEPNLGDVQLNGSEKVGLELYGTAINEFTTAISINPKFKEAYCRRGEAKTKIGDFDGAIADYTKAIEIDPRYSRPYIFRGFTKLWQGKDSEAQKDFDTADALDSIWRDVYKRKTAYIMENRKPTNGQVAPSTAADYVNRGVVRYGKGDADGAIADFNKAIEIDPKSAEAYYDRGNLRRAKSDLDGAIADYTKAIEIDPQYANARYNRAVSRYDKGDLDGTIADANMYISLKPSSPEFLAEAFFILGGARSDKGDLKEAISDFTLSINFFQTPKAFLRRGLAKLKQFKDADAQQDFDAALKLDSTLKSQLEIMVNKIKQTRKPNGSGHPRY